MNQEDQKVAKALMDSYVFSCTFKNTSGETINFFNSIMSMEKSAHAFPLKRADNAMSHLHLEFYAILKDVEETEASKESLQVGRSHD